MRAVSLDVFGTYETCLTRASSAWATRTLIVRKLKGLEEFVGA